MSCLLATYILVVPWFLFIMSADRYTAIVHPYKYQQWYSTRKMQIVLFAVASISIFGGTAWPLINIKLFYPSVNNRFGLGPMFLLGQHTFENSRELLLYHLLWALPLFAVLGFNVYTAYYCMFAMSKSHHQRRQSSHSESSTQASRKESVTSVINFLHEHTTKKCCNMFSKCKTTEHEETNHKLCCLCFKTQVGTQTPVTSSINTVCENAHSNRHYSVSVESTTHQRNEAVEAFWILSIMTLMFLISLLPSFIFTTLVPVPCDQAVHWTWLYASIQFLHMSHPCQNVIIYNYRSQKFREAGKAVIRKLFDKLSCHCM
ncbi:uncharacterized protein LOC108949313 [Ciona intestinalis]